MTATRTHTHVIVPFANPFMICNQCKRRVEGFVSSVYRDDLCEHDFDNYPCGHAAGIQSLCPSWSPVSGCQCLEHIGTVNHAPRV